MAFLLDRLATTGMTTSQLDASLPRYYRSMGKKAFGHGHLGAIMQGLQQKFPNAQVDRADGLKLIFPDSWIHVRASNTEPILRYAVEAKSESRLNDLLAQVEHLL